MKQLSIFLLLFCCCSLAKAADFDTYFEPRSLRMDVYHCGNHDDANYVFDRFLVEPFWGGSKVKLIDEFNFGTNRVRVIDAASNEVIYSHGYCTLFQEWQTTEESKIMNRCYEESVSVPLPKSKAVIEIDVRNYDGVYEEVFSMTFNPKEIFNTPEQKYHFPVYDAMINGDPAHKVDIVIIPDGYTAEELDRFKSDCDQFVNVLKSFDPFSTHINDFNVRGVLAPSEESGVDVPHDNKWVRTIVDSHFDTFYTDRYCMTDSYFAVKDVAACTPYDQIYILVNSDIYGGGGIYNFYSVSTSGNMSSAKVIIHEFGHAFAGLADEYYDDVAYEDFYNLKIEPWEFNITTMVDFDSKWKFLLDKDIPIPTPAEENYYNTLGVFEGGGYSAKNIYRPSYDCMMRTFRDDKFCGACKYIIERMIESYTK